MKLQKIAGIPSILIAFTLEFQSTFPLTQHSLQSATLAQTPAQTKSGRKATADQLMAQGLIQFNTSQFQVALQTWQQALKIYQELQDRPNELRVMGNIGEVHRILGNFNKATEYFEKSREIAQALQDRPGVLSALGNLGNLYVNLGDFTRAIQYLEQTLAISRELKDRRNESTTLGNLGLAYINSGDYTKGIDYQKKALELSRQMNDPAGEARALGNLGLAYQQLGDYPKAIEYQQQALVMIRPMNDRRSEAAILGNLGKAYYSLSNYGQAAEYARQVLAISRQLQDPINEGKALNNLGAALYKQGNLGAAEKALKEVIQIWERLRTSLGNNDAYKILIFDEQSYSYGTLQQVLIAQQKIDEALELSERGKARAFVELLTARLATSDPATLGVKSLNIQQIKQIAQAQKATLVQYSIIRNEELYIWVISPTGEIAFRAVNFQTLNINLSQVTEKTRVAAATGRGLSESDTVFANLVNETRAGVGIETGEIQSSSPSTNQLPQRCRGNRCLQQMYKFLIEPIAEFLPKNPTDRVIFVPHQSVFLVPFPALQDSAGKYLIEKHTILTAPSIQVLQLTRQAQQIFRQSPSQNILVVGNPTMPQVGNPPKPLSPLPGSETEALVIAKMLNTQALIGSQATETTVAQQMSQSRIIHLATHGLLNEVRLREMPGAIALAPTGTADGLLTSNEIMNLKLNAELVVLSACNTGRGKLTGDGVIGLSRALITAGVSSIIVSLWRVPDHPTSDLMTEFYRQMQGGSDKAQALRQAMLMTMKKYPQPSDWAAFVLIGEAE